MFKLKSDRGFAHIIPILLILFLAAAGVVWYLAQDKKKEVEQAAVEAGLGAEVYDKAANPVEDKLPETNPFKTKTNPFE